MISDEKYLKHQRDAVMALRREDKQQAFNRLIENGLTGVDAEDIIDRTMKDIEKQNRSIGHSAFWGGILGTAISIALLIMFSRLFYVILGISLLAIIGGVVLIIKPSKFKITTDFNTDE